jgi:hypothetical protein
MMFAAQSRRSRRGNIIRARRETPQEYHLPCLVNYLPVICYNLLNRARSRRGYDVARPGNGEQDYILGYYMMPRPPFIYVAICILCLSRLVYLWRARH